MAGSKQKVDDDEDVGLLVLLPFQIIVSLIFLTSNLITHLIHKFIQNIISFVASFIIQGLQK